MSFKRNFAFLFILILGFSYLFLFSTTFFKSVTGFFMQLMFLVEAVKYNQYTSLNHSLLPFWLNLTVGPFILYCTYLIARGVFTTLKQYLNTVSFVKNLRLKSRGHYYIFQSPHPQAFTFGLLKPKILISSSLIKLCTPTELKSILYHESMHLRSRDPLKDLIINFISLITPTFPGKSYVFALHNALVEINSDDYASAKLHTPKPLASALSKIIQYPQLPLFSTSPFSASKYRFQTLIGANRTSLVPFFAFNTILLSILLFATVFSSRTSLFYQCRHLLTCALNLISPKPLVEVMKHNNCSDSPPKATKIDANNSCQYHLMPVSRL